MRITHAGSADRVCCRDCAPPSTSPRTVPRGRVPVEPVDRSYAGPFAMRGVERNYDVQAFTGYASSTVPAGQWNRGILYRQAMPALHLSSVGRVMYDVTDPATWLPNP